MIELAARVWEVSPGQALRRLAEEGVPIPRESIDATSINKYVVAHPQTRNRLLDFWRKCREYLPQAQSSEILGLKERFRLRTHLSKATWMSGLGNMVGANTCAAIEHVFLPKLSKKSWKQKQLGGGRTFHGGGWKEALVVPYFDLPDRICGLYCVGRNGQKGDTVFRVPHIGRGTLPHEAGLACLWAVEQAQEFGNNVFACGDPMLALRLHMRHYTSASVPLPLVAYYDGLRARTQGAWKAIEHKKPILFDWQMTPQTLHQAMLCNGLLSLVGLEEVSRKSIDHWVRLGEPRELLRRVQKKANTWQVTLEEWSHGTKDSAVEHLLTGLARYGRDVVDAACVTDRMRRLARLGDRASTTTVGRAMVVTELNGSMWHTPRSSRRFTGNSIEPQQITNFLLRVDRTVLITNANGLKNVPAYSGRIIFDGEEIPFTSSIESFRMNMESELSKIVTRHKPGKPLIISSGWNKRILEAAIKLSGLN